MEQDIPQTEYLKIFIVVETSASCYRQQRTKKKNYSARKKDLKRFQNKMEITRKQTILDDKIKNNKIKKEPARNKIQALATKIKVGESYMPVMLKTTNWDECETSPIGANPYHWHDTDHNVRHSRNMVMRLRTPSDSLPWNDSMGELQKLFPLRKTTLISQKLLSASAPPPPSERCLTSRGSTARGRHPDRCRRRRHNWSSQTENA